MEKIKVDLLVGGFLLIFLTVSCSPNNYQILNQKESIPIEGAIYLWNLEKDSVIIQIQDKTIYSQFVEWTVPNHGRAIILFYYQDNILYAKGDTTFVIPENFIINSIVNESSNLDTININFTKSLMITFNEEKQKTHTSKVGTLLYFR